MKMQKRKNTRNRESTSSQSQNQKDLVDESKTPSFTKNTHVRKNMILKASRSL